MMVLNVSVGHKSLFLFPLNRTHARGMDNKDFWKVYYEQLEIVAGLAGKTTS